MRNLILSLVFFSLLLNFSVALMIDVVPAFNGMDSRLGIDTGDFANSTYGDSEILDQFGNPINANPGGQDISEVSSDTLMDRTVLGGVLNIIHIIDKYMFGFIVILKAIFGAWVPALIFNVLKIVISMLYSITIFEIISGKKVLGD